jgi:inorganic triphosphatase YgiF
MAEPAEIELKLAVVSGRPHQVARMLPPAEFEQVLLDDQYFDTPDAELRRRGLVLRVRREDDRWVQTLKSSSRLRELVANRGEWEVELARGGARPGPDLKRFDAAALREVMRAGFDAARLGAVFRSRVKRRRAVLSHGASRIEVALDDGYIQARVDGRKRRIAIAEVELELMDGDPADLLDLARHLVDQRKGPARLVPALRSKGERGYALALDDQAAALRASARGFAAELRVAMTTAEALRAVMRHGLAIVVANADALRDAPNPELVHQTRVALRRMRSAIRLFDRDHGDISAELADRLRWLAQALGQARDWDVLLDSSLPAFLEHARDAVEGGDLQKAAERERKRAIARTIRAVSARRYAKLVLALARWTVTAPPLATPTIGEVAAPLLDELADRMFAKARGFARLTTHQRHRVRIQAKRLRYALDLLSVALPERAAADYIDALSHLQDALGELNDVTVAVVSLTSLTGKRGIRRALKAWQQQVESGDVRAAAGRIAALERRSRPWSR